MCVFMQYSHTNYQQSYPESSRVLGCKRKEVSIPHLAGVRRRRITAGVQQTGNTAKCLEYKRLPVQHVELLTDKLNGASEDGVRLVVTVDAEQSRHHMEEPGREQ